MSILFGYIPEKVSILSKNAHSKSLSTFVHNEFADKKLKALRISMKPYIDQGWMENIPLYSTEEFVRIDLEDKSV